jgi:hypothetical protein
MENLIKRSSKAEQASIQGRPKDHLDKQIHEAAVQLVGSNPAEEQPLLRFVLLCTARSQFENEGVVGIDPELQWVQVAKDAFVTAAEDKEGYLPLSHTLSESPSGKEAQRELYDKTITNLIVVNTDKSPNTHWGIDFATQVADGAIQIRYIEVTRTASFPEEL